MPKRKLEVEILGEARSLAKASKEGQSALGQFEQKLRKSTDATDFFGSKLAGALSVGAVVAFGKKAIDAFQSTALEAGKMADATGLSVEQASRWREVAGDMGVEAGSLETALGRMTKTLSASPGLFAKYGVAVARAKDGTTDVNGTFLNLVDKLNAIKDPAKRAEVAAATLGKGWQGLAEIIGTGRSGLVGRLAEVSDAKVINADELAKAKEFRDTMDRLRDAVDDLAINGGQVLIPVVSSLADVLSTAAEAAGPLLELMIKLQGIGNESAKKNGLWDNVKSLVLGNFGAQVKKLQELVGNVLEGPWKKDHSEEANKAGAAAGGAYWAGWQEALLRAQAAGAADPINPLGDMAKVLGSAELDAAIVTATRRMNQQLQASAREAARTERAIRDIEAAWSSLTGAITDDTSWLDLQDDFDATLGTVLETLDKGGKATATEMREAERQVNDLKLEVIQYGKEILRLPESKVSEIVALIDEGKLDEARAIIADLTRRRAMTVDLVLGRIPHVLANSVTVERRARGGDVAAGRPYWVGDGGEPELFVPDQAGTIVPNHVLTGNASGGNVPNGAHSGTTVIQLVLDGRVLTEVVHEGLLVKKRRTGNLQLV